MSVWKQWIKRRRMAEEFGDESDPGSKFQFNRDDDDFAEDYEKVQTELFKAVMAKYPEETMGFLNHVADRGDEEIANLLRKLQKERGPSMAKEPHHPKDRDEIMPSSADTGYNPEFSD